jgi:hypothetical protein
MIYYALDSVFFVDRLGNLHVHVAVWIADFVSLLERIRVRNSSMAA